MIKFLTAYTREIDDPEKAVREIQEKLDFQKKGLEHSAALLFCYTDFISSGVMEAVSNSLPCEVLGCTSQYFALNSAEDEIMLIVTVLTSDDTEFATGLSEALTPDNANDQIRALYQKIASVSAAAPSLIFAIQPTMLTLGGDVMSAALDQVSGGKIPVFGTCAIDVAQKIRSPKIMYQGRAYADRMALLFFKGPVRPRFFASLFPEQFFLTQDAVITGVSGNLITTINNTPAASFLEDLGLLQSNFLKVTPAIPLVIHYIDGSSRQVVILSDITPEGAVISNRNVRVGGVLKLGAITADHILESVKVLVRDIKQNGNGEGLFMFSCFMRTVATGGNSMAEIEAIQKEFAGSPQPYVLCYSGGELCPQYTEAGGMRNRFYQYALIACQL
jgi:hypothetical protein